MFGDGKQTRSFQHVSDLVAGMVAVMDNDEHLGPFNVGNPGVSEFSCALGRPKNKSRRRPRNQPANQPTNQPTDQPINRPTNRSPD